MDNVKSVKFAIKLLRSDDAKTLMAYGHVTRDELIAEAIAQGDIEADEKDVWEKAEYSSQGYMKAVPHDDGTWYHDSKEGVRGAFKATTISMYC